VLRQEILAQHAQRLLSMGFAELVQGVEVRAGGDGVIPSPFIFCGIKYGTIFFRGFG